MYEDIDLHCTKCPTCSISVAYRRRGLLHAAFSLRFWGITAVKSLSSTRHLKQNTVRSDEAATVKAPQSSFSLPLGH